MSDEFPAFGASNYAVPDGKGGFIIKGWDEPLPQTSSSANNVGNLRPVGSDTGFQQFNTPEEGIAAMDKNLEVYGSKHGINTLRGVISRYAPSTENDTENYINEVSKRTSIKPDDKIDLSNPAVRHILSGAMMIQEKGVKHFTQQESQPIAPDDIFTPQEDSDIVKEAKSFLSIQDKQKPAVSEDAKKFKLSEGPTTLESFGTGVGMGAANLGLGGKELVGHGIEALSNIMPESISPSMESYGQSMAKNAATNIKQLEAINAPYQEAHPIANIGGEVGANVGAIMTGGEVPIIRNVVGQFPKEASIANRLYESGKAGLTTSLLQPVGEELDYWKKKGIQAGLGTVGGIVGYPLGVAVGSTIKGTANLAVKGAGLVEDAYQGLKNQFEQRFGANPISVNATNLAISDPAVNAAIKAGLSSETQAKIATASPEIKAKIINDVKSGNKIDPAMLESYLLDDSLPVKLDLTKAQHSGDETAISMERELRGKNGFAQLQNDQNKKLVQNLDAMHTTFAPDVTAPNNFVAGENLIKSVENKIAANDKETADAYLALRDANGGKLPIDSQKFGNNVIAKLNETDRLSYLEEHDKVLFNKINDYASGKKELNFNLFEALRSDLASSMRKADRAGDGTLNHVLGEIRNELEQIPMTGESAAIKTIADNARASAKKGFNLERDIPVYKAVSSKNKNAEPDNFVKNFISGGNSKDLKNMIDLIKDDPEAIQTMKASVMNYIKEHSVNVSGDFNQSRYNGAIKLLDTNKKLQMLFSPEEIQTMKNVGAAAKKAQHLPAGHFVSTANTGASLNAQGFGNVTSTGIDLIAGTPGLATAATKGINILASRQQEQARQTAINEMLQPYAGLSLPSQYSNIINKVPTKLGQVGSISGGYLGSNAVPLINKNQLRKEQPKQ